MTILTKSKAQDDETRARFALLVNLHEEVMKKLAEQIQVEKEFITVLTSFLSTEQRLRIEEARRREQEEIDRKATVDDGRF